MNIWHELIYPVQFDDQHKSHAKSAFICPSTRTGYWLWLSSSKCNWRERLPDGGGNPHAKCYYRICTSLDDLSILTRIGSLQQIYNLLFVSINTADLRLLTYTTFHYLLQRLIKLEIFRFPFCISRTTMNWSGFWRIYYLLLFFRKLHILEHELDAHFVHKTSILPYKRNGCKMILLYFTVYNNCLMRVKFIIFLITTK